MLKHNIHKLIFECSDCSDCNDDLDITVSKQNEETYIEIEKYTNSNNSERLSLSLNEFYCLINLMLEVSDYIDQWK